MALNKIVASRNKKRTTVVPFPGAVDDGSTLSLDFTAMSAAELTSRFTFTRSGTTATYVDSDGYIKVAAANQPRFDHHPITRQRLGFLVELSSINYSSGGIRAGNTTSVTQNTNEVLDPMGTNTAAKVVKTTDSVGYSKFRAITGSVGGATGWAVSVFVKRGDVDVTTSIEHNSAQDWGTTGGGQPIVTFSLTSSGCTLSSATGQGLDAASVFVEEFRDGWYRIGYSFTSTASSATNPDLLVRHSGANGTYMYVFGPQVEAATSMTASSYIPHNPTLGGGQTARSEDICNMSGTAFSSWFSSTEGTFWQEVGPQRKRAGNRHSLRVDPTSYDGKNRFIFILNGRGSAIWYSSSSATNPNGANYSTTQVVDLTVDKFHRMAGTYDSITSPLTMSANGSAVSVSNNAEAPLNLTKLNLFGANCCYSKIKYWPRKLSNAELQYITSDGYNYSRSDLVSIDGSKINLKFTAPEYEGVLPNIMSFVRGSGGTYRNDAGHVSGIDLSSTSNVIGTGSKTFILSATSGIDRRYATGNKVVVNNGVNSMTGTVTSYDEVSQSLVLNIASISGSGTFTAWTIGRNEPRWEWNAAGTDLDGLLIEGQATNLVNWSQSFATSGGTNNNWADTNITRNSTNNASPDGSNNALRVTSSAANGTVISTAAVTSGSSTDRVFSVWLRRVSGSGNIQLTMNNGTTWSTVTISSTWARYSVSSSSTSARVGIRIVTSGDQIEAWGAQLEVGLEATSYIPTAANQATRLADQLSVNFSYGGPNPYNSNTGAMVVDIGPRPTGFGIGYSFVYPDAVNGDSWVIEGDGYSTQVVVEGTETFGFNLNTYMPDRQRSVFSYNTITETYHSRISDGTTVYDLETLNSPGEFPNGSELTQIWVGSFDGSTGHINTHVKEFVYYPFDLAPDTIAVLLNDIPAQ